jgi:integrase
MPWVEKRIAAGGKPRYVALYRDPTGAKRSAGTFPSKVVATRAAYDAARTIKHSTWIDPKDGKITFTDYVEQAWWPSRHLEVSTAAAYRSNLDHHLIPYFGGHPLDAILPSTVQAWVTHAINGGLSPRSVRKYHTLLHGIFARAVRDRILLSNPAAHTELPKVITRRMRVLTPDEFDNLLANVPAEHRAMVLLAAETGLRWGELVALRPHELDARTATLTVQDVYVEVSKKNSPTGQRMILRHYPKDNEPRTLDHYATGGRPRGPHHGPGHRPGRAAVRQPGRTAHLAVHLPRPRLATRGQGHRPGLPPTLARPTPHQRLLAAGRRRRPQDCHGPPRPHPAVHHPAVPAYPAQHRRHGPRSTRPHPRTMNGGIEAHWLSSGHRS